MLNRELVKLYESESIDLSRIFGIFARIFGIRLGFVKPKPESLDICRTRIQVSEVEYSVFRSLLTSWSDCEARISIHCRSTGKFRGETASATGTEFLWSWKLPVPAIIGPKRPKPGWSEIWLQFPSPPRKRVLTSPSIQTTYWRWLRQNPSWQCGLATTS